MATTSIYCQCPSCGMVWWHVQPAAHIVCPNCCIDLTITFEHEAEAAGGE